MPSHFSILHVKPKLSTTSFCFTKKKPKLLVTNTVACHVLQVWVKAYLNEAKNIVIEANFDSVFTKGLLTLLVQGLSHWLMDKIVKLMSKKSLELRLEVENTKVFAESWDQKAKIEVNSKSSISINDKDTNSRHWFETDDELSDFDTIVVWRMIPRGTNIVAILLEWVLTRMWLFLLHLKIQSRAAIESKTVVGKSRSVVDSSILNLPNLQTTSWQKFMLNGAVGIDNYNHPLDA